ncbi:MAG: ABC transporter ATP-binding protein [Chloroflexi bacterium]|nr:ABC transporter ATP-binding protein [Chloroflexota bacterium]
MSEIRLERIVKTFKDVRAVDDVSLTVAQGEFMVLLGPSGCGKTTLLRSIAGLEDIDAGRVVIGGRDVTELPPRARRVAMVFQSYAVFPHMSVFENIAFGLRMSKVEKTTLTRRVRSAAELLHIEALLDRYPSQVSGGQRQRIAVARAIAMEPDVLLMDEPLSNLDALLRLEMRAELKRLLNEIGSTTVYVTHDQVEAMSMGDRIAVMRAGRILQLGDPLTIYQTPVDRFVGGFIGSPPMNFLPATVRDGGDGLRAEVQDAGSLRLDGTAAWLTGRIGQAVTMGVRAEDIDVVEDGGADGVLRGRILVVEPLGSHDLLTVRLGESRLKVATRPGIALRADDPVVLRPQVERLVWLDPESDRALERPASAA